MAQKGKMSHHRGASHQHLALDRHKAVQGTLAGAGDNR
jgi:hypothetical protein